MSLFDLNQICQKSVYRKLLNLGLFSELNRFTSLFKILNKKDQTNNQIVTQAIAEKS